MGMPSTAQAQKTALNPLSEVLFFVNPSSLSFAAWIVRRARATSALGDCRVIHSCHPEGRDNIHIGGQYGRQWAFIQCADLVMH